MTRTRQQFVVRALGTLRIGRIL